MQASHPQGWPLLLSSPRLFHECSNGLLTTAFVLHHTDKGRSTPSGNLDALIELNEWVTQECSGDTALGHARSTLDKLLTSGTDLALTRETRETLVGVVSLIREVHKGEGPLSSFPESVLLGECMTLWAGRERDPFLPNLFSLQCACTLSE